MVQMVKKIRKLIEKYKTIKKNQAHLIGFRNGLSHRIKENTVLFESLHGKSVDGHIFHLINSIHKKNLKLTIFVAARDIENAKKKFAHYHLNNINFVKHMSSKYGYLLATCKYLINDNTFYPFYSKRKGQIYYNIWHGTPLKTLGKDMEDILGYANVQRNFFNADAILVSNNYTKNILVDSHNIDKIYNGKVVVGPSPRNSALFDRKASEQIKKNLGWKNKKIVMYMPTWRGVDGNVQSDDDRLIKDLAYISEHIDKDTVVVFKRHTMQKHVNIDRFNNIFDFPQEYELYHFLSCVDILITDYSSIMYDFLNTDKKIILYTYDKEEYLNTRGVYEDIDRYPFVQVDKISDLVFEINHQSNNNYVDFKKRFCPEDKINGADLITDYLFTGNKSEEIHEYSVRNDKKNVFIFCGGLWDNGITTALLNTLNSIDTSKRNYILCFGKGKMQKKYEFRLKLLPKNVTYYPIPGISINSIFERVIYKKYLKNKKYDTKLAQKIVKKIYNREIRRIFGETEIDWFIHYTGFDRKYDELVTYMTNKTMIFVHTDMFADYKNKNNFNPKILFKAYRAATKIVLVNEHLKSGFEKNLPDVVDKLSVMDNFLGEDRIRKLSEVNVFSTLIDARFHYVDSSKYAVGLNKELQNTDLMDSKIYLQYNTILKNIKHKINQRLEVEGLSGDSFIKNRFVRLQTIQQATLKMVRKDLLNVLFPDRLELIESLSELFNFKKERMEIYIDNILLVKYRLQKVIKEFPYTIKVIDEYKSALEDSFNGNFDKSNDELIDHMIHHFGISKMRLINELIDPNIEVFMNIGRFDKQKGHDRLIRAFEKYNVQHSNSRLIIVAPYGPIKKETINLIKKSPCKENIYLLGRMNNPYALLKMVDVFVLSSYYEGLGLVVYEALALDKQVITVNLDTTTRCLKNNEVITVENSERGILQGFLSFHKGERTKNKFNFEEYKRNAVKEFETLFVNSKINKSEGIT